MAYIIVSESRKQYNFKNEFIGMSGKRALHYTKSVGRRRIYRHQLGFAPASLTLLVYKSEKYAQRVCDEVNKVYNDDFKLQELTKTLNHESIIDTATRTSTTFTCGDGQ